MSPEFGSTCAIFPIDAETLRYLEFSGRPPEQIELVEAYAKEQGLWHDENSEEPTFSDTLELDLVDVVPSIAGPKRPQDRVLADRVAATRSGWRSRTTARRRRHDDEAEDESVPASDPSAGPATPDHGQAPHGETGGPGRRRRKRAAPVTLADGTETELDHGHVVIAAITSCTNTSNPSVMLGAGLLARNAVAAGTRRSSRGSRPRWRPAPRS